LLGYRQVISLSVFKGTYIAHFSVGRSATGKDRASLKPVNTKKSL
jgi:hypothetical protein